MNYPPDEQSVSPLPPAMTEATAEDWQRIRRADAAYGTDLTERLLAALRMLRDDRCGFAVDRLEHCLQAATRAEADGRDDEYVVCALLHDIGAAFAPVHHAEFAAAILAPHISPGNLWMVRNHELFQGYYFKHFFGGDRHARERFRGHPHYARTVEFCHLYDQASFDPDYVSRPLEHFVPMIKRVLGSRRHAPGAVT